ncbi:MAG TPA: hypothetical protein VK750_06525, partial [Cytophagaceae bacterium]|nr:hypothetical protein [Cytophagaceae bacterium]
MKFSLRSMLIRLFFSAITGILLSLVSFAQSTKQDNKQSILDAPANFALGHAKSQRGHYEDAIPFYDKAIALNENYFDAYQARADAKYNL